MLEVNKTYLLKILAGSSILRYTAEIKKIDEHFITFKDKDGQIFNYNINFVLEYNEK